MDNVSPIELAFELGRLLDSPDLNWRGFDSDEDRAVVLEALTASLMTFMKHVHGVGFTNGYRLGQCSDLQWDDDWKEKVDVSRLCKSKER